MFFPVKTQYILFRDVVFLLRHDFRASGLRFHLQMSVEILNLLKMPTTSVKTDTTILRQLQKKLHLKQLVNLLGQWWLVNNWKDIDEITKSCSSASFRALSIRMMFWAFYTILTTYQKPRISLLMSPFSDLPFKLWNTQQTWAERVPLSHHHLQFYFHRIWTMSHLPHILVKGVQDQWKWPCVLNLCRL